MVNGETRVNGNTVKKEEEVRPGDKEVSSS